LKIVEIREKTCAINSLIRNACIDFSKVRLSLVAGVTDMVRNGKPVVGYGSNSNGRSNLDTAIAYAKALSPYKLFWYEEAGATRWILSRRPRCATIMPTRWSPAKTCSPCRTRAT